MGFVLDHCTEYMEFVIDEVWICGSADRHNSRKLVPTNL